MLCLWYRTGQDTQLNKFCTKKVSKETPISCSLEKTHQIAFFKSFSLIKRPASVTSFVALFITQKKTFLLLAGYDMLYAVSVAVYTEFTGCKSDMQGRAKNESSFSNKN